MTFMHYLGATLVLVLIVGVGMFSGKQVKSAKDFSDGGRKASSGMVMGALIGTLVGGASTIGTAQLAFTNGFSAWWFTLGGGIGVLLLGLVFSKNLYDSGISTMPQIITREWGRETATAAALLNSLGSFLSIVSQILSGVALITAVSVTISPTVATIITILLMLAYVVFGGALGAGYVGIAKTIIMYLSVGICGFVAIRLMGGVGTFFSSPLLPKEQYFNIIGRGASKDLGAGLSLILGVLTTQAYIQAVISAKSLRISRKGIYLSAFLIPLIGIAGIFVGLYMRLNYPDIQSKLALPLFILEKMPPLVAGIMLATLLVALVGTGAGVGLGISSVFFNDLFKAYSKKKLSDVQALAMTRGILIVVLLLSALVSMGDMGGFILTWSFMSMGLRGAVAFGPMVAAVFFPGKIPQRYAMMAIIVGPLITLIGNFILPPSVDALFMGVGASILILAVGYFSKNDNLRSIEYEKEKEVSSK